jgi:FkbM family methyltransferase
VRQVPLKHWLPPAARDRLRPLWYNGLRWPMPLWRLRGYGDFTVGGQTIRVHDVATAPNDWWARQAVHGQHEAEVGDFLREHLRPGDVFFDVGANFGQYALFAAKAGATVHAFEPDPTVQAALLRNLRTNAVADRVTAVAAAISDGEGSLRLHPDHLGTPTSQRGNGSGGVTVRTVALDTYCAETGVWPDVMKVDIEGAEVIALGPSAAETLSRARAVVVEVHEHWARDLGGDPDALVARLSEGRQVVELGGRWEGNYNVGFVRA